MITMRDIVKQITNDGWQLISMRGPHWQFVHPRKPGRITISAGLYHEVGKGTARSIARQAGLSFREKKHNGALSSSR